MKPWIGVNSSIAAARLEDRRLFVDDWSLYRCWCPR